MLLVQLSAFEGAGCCQYDDPTPLKVASRQSVLSAVAVMAGASMTARWLLALALLVAVLSGGRVDGVGDVRGIAHDSHRLLSRVPVTQRQRVTRGSDGLLAPDAGEGAEATVTAPVSKGPGGSAAADVLASSQQQRAESKQRLRRQRLTSSAVPMSNTTAATPAQPWYRTERVEIIVLAMLGGIVVLVCFACLVCFVNVPRRPASPTPLQPGERRATRPCCPWICRVRADTCVCSPVIAPWLWWCIV